MLGIEGRVSLSEHLWGLDWRRHFPKAVGKTGVTARVSSYAEASAFAQANFELIYNDAIADSRFLWLEFCPAKAKYYELAGDFFAFEHEGRIVGIYAGTPFDWSTYYLRSVGLLPSYQGQRLFSDMTAHLVDCLAQYPVDRIEAHVSPANLPNVRSLTKLNFNVTGTMLSERWGSLVQLTRHLSRKHERAFLDQFCQGLHPQWKRSEMDQ